MKDICEDANACNVDQHSFKAYLSRWMAAATQMAPFTYDTTIGLLRSSAAAAAAQCTGTTPGIEVPSGQVCGLRWDLNGTWDGSNGVGQQMAAMEVILGTLIKQVQAPLTNSTGGTSASNPTAGHNTSATPAAQDITSATKASKGGAWFLTSFILLVGLWSIWFMISRAWEREGADGSTVGGVNNQRRSVVQKGKGREIYVEKAPTGVLTGIDESAATRMHAHPSNRPISMPGQTLDPSSRTDTRGNTM